MSLFKSKPKLIQEKNVIPLLSIDKSLEAISSEDFSNGSVAGIWSLDPVDRQFALLRTKGNEHRTVPLRCEYHSIILCLAGSMELQCGQYECALVANTAVVIPAGEIYSFTKVSSDNSTWTIWFNKGFHEDTTSTVNDLEDLLSLSVGRTPLITTDEAQFNQWSRWCDQIRAECELKGKNYLQIVGHSLWLLLYSLDRSHSKGLAVPAFSRKDRMFQEFIALVEHHFQQRRTVMEYAELMHITAKHLSETVKKVTNHTALYFIQERIIREAQYLLVHSSLNVKQIANKLSFDTPSHFVRFFKHLTGQTPLKYRQSFS